MSNSFVRVPPDGAGKRIHTKQHNVSGLPVEIQHNHITSPNNPNNSLIIDDRGAAYTRFTEGEPIFDSYNSFKVSSANIVGVYEHTVDSYDDLFYIDTQFGGQSTFDILTSSVRLTVTDAGTSKCVRTTNRYHYYQPGTSSTAIICASCGDTGKPNNIRQWGLFDDENGFFFELNGTTINIVRRGNTSGTIQELRIPQSSWNVDKLDGTGISGININITGGLKYFITNSWPFGAPRFGIYYGSTRIVCHQIIPTDYPPVPNIETMSLPIRFANYNIGATSSASELKEIMAIVESEGNTDYTFWRFADLRTRFKPVTENIPVLSVRSKILLDDGNHNHINSYPENLSVFSSGSCICVKLVWHDEDALSGDTWTMNSVGGPLEADSGATSIDENNDSYWETISLYVEKDKPMNIDLRPYFELNDEGVLLSADRQTQSVLSFVCTAFEGVATVSMDLTYRGLY